MSLLLEAEAPVLQVLNTDQISEKGIPMARGAQDRGESQKGIHPGEQMHCDSPSESVSRPFFRGLFSRSRDNESTMPIIRVSIAEGKSDKELRSLTTALHDAAEKHVGASPDGTTVLIEDIKKTHWSRANTTIAERRAAERER